MFPKIEKYGMSKGEMLGIPSHYMDPDRLRPPLKLDLEKKGRGKI